MLGVSGVSAGFPLRGRVLRTIPPQGEDRGNGGARAPATFLALSLLLHGAVLSAAFLVDAPAAPKPQQEFAVEIVPEVPKAPAASPPPAKSPSSPKPPPSEPTTGKPVESQQAEPPPPPKPALAERVEKPVERPAPAKAAERPPRTPARAAAPDQSESELKAMRDELASLKAEQAALKAQAPAAAPQAPGRGLLDSLQAVALPGETEDGDGEVVGYQSVVFSRLAKAKAIGGELGQPGTAGVSFDIDDHGALLDVRLSASSGIAGLDAEALAIVRKAAPFPPPPQGAQRSFSANVSFVAGPNR